MSTRTSWAAAPMRVGPSMAGPVVVGVDGGPRSIRALRWAAEEARLRGAVVIAVHACESPGPVAPYAPVHPQQPGWEQEVRDEENHLADLVRDALGVPGVVAVRQVCEPASPVRALLSHADGAALLVLATSADTTGGTGIGATALACVRHAPCPVVVLPSEGAA